MLYVNMPYEQTLTAITKRINSALRDVDTALLLLSGGSNVDAAVAIRRRLELGGCQLRVGLVDERFGKLGHANSNWEQLQRAGFDFRGTLPLPVLVSQASLGATAKNYATAIDQALDAAAISIGLFGIGADGHTAGILPSSPALSADGDVCAYRAPDFERITITGRCIKRLDLAMVVAYGAAKHGQIERLGQDIDPQRQPAQLLKQAGELIVYNDHKGDKH